MTRGRHRKGALNIYDLLCAHVWYCPPGRLIEMRSWLTAEAVFASQRAGALKRRQVCGLTEYDRERTALGIQFAASMRALRPM